MARIPLSADAPRSPHSARGGGLSASSARAVRSRQEVRPSRPPRHPPGGTLTRSNTSVGSPRTLPGYRSYPTEVSVVPYRGIGRTLPRYLLNSPSIAQGQQSRLTGATGILPVGCEANKVAFALQRARRPLPRRLQRARRPLPRDFAFPSTSTSSLHLSPPR